MYRHIDTRFYKTFEFTCWVTLLVLYCKDTGSTFAVCQLPLMMSGQCLLLEAVAGRVIVDMSPVHAALASVPSL